jgi:hypothetical protein
LEREVLQGSNTVAVALDADGQMGLLSTEEDGVLIYKSTPTFNWTSITANITNGSFSTSSYQFSVGIDDIGKNIIIGGGNDDSGFGAIWIMKNVFVIPSPYFVPPEVVIITIWAAGGTIIISAFVFTVAGLCYVSSVSGESVLGILSSMYEYAFKEPSFVLYTLIGINAYVTQWVFILMYRYKREYMFYASLGVLFAPGLAFHILFVYFHGSSIRRILLTAFPAQVFINFEYYNFPGMTEYLAVKLYGVELYELHGFELDMVRTGLFCGTYFGDVPQFIFQCLNANFDDFLHSNPIDLLCFFSTGLSIFVGAFIAPCLHRAKRARKELSTAYDY